LVGLEVFGQKVDLRRRLRPAIIIRHSDEREAHMSSAGQVFLVVVE
jgi:hypothetical protein